MPLKKGESNSGIKNLEGHQFLKGKSGYHFTERLVVCEECGAEFNSTGPCSKYCSAKCKESYRYRGLLSNQSSEFICEFCGKIFKRRGNNLGRFCSRQCSGLHKIRNAKKNYGILAFMYLPWKCNSCGDTDLEHLIVHHIDCNRSNGSISNLQILCANCHTKLHFGKGFGKSRKLDLIRSYREDVYSYESFTEGFQKRNNQ